LDAAAERFRRVGERNTLRNACEVATVLRSTVLAGHGAEGDGGAAREKAALAALAGREDVALSVATLRRALRAAELIEELGGLEACGGLTVAHFTAVAVLPPDQRREALVRAQRTGASARALERSCRQRPAARTPYRGQTPISCILRRLKEAQRLFLSHEFDPEAVAASLRQDEAEDAARCLSALTQRLREMRRALAEFSSGSTFVESTAPRPAPRRRRNGRDHR
jgi:hypothetical protein